MKTVGIVITVVVVILIITGFTIKISKDKKSEEINYQKLKSATDKERARLNGIITLMQKTMIKKDSRALPTTNPATTVIPAGNSNAGL